MNVLPIVLGTITLVAGTGAAVAYHLGVFDGHPWADGTNCQSAASTPLGAGEARDGTIRFIVDNQGDAVHGVLCAYDSNLEKRFQLMVEVPASRQSTWEATVPTGNYLAVSEFRALQGDSYSILSVSGNTVHCSESTLSLNAQIRFTGSGSSGGVDSGDGCSSGSDTRIGHAPIAAGFRDDTTPVVPQAPSGSGPGPTVAAAGTLGVTLAAVFLWKWTQTKYFVLGLFSRLQRSTLLDQKVRAQIHELVTQDPGINANTIAQRLELGQGQALHHLRILVREKLLAGVRLPGANHYFLAGRYAPTQMRALAVLRSPGAERLLRWVRGSPGGNVGEAARHLGVSHSRASKLARRLADAGLLVRNPEGRSLRLLPGPLAAPSTA